MSLIISLVSNVDDLTILIWSKKKKKKRGKWIMANVIKCALLIISYEIHTHIYTKENTSNTLYNLRKKNWKTDSITRSHRCSLSLYFSIYLSIYLSISINPSICLSPSFMHEIIKGGVKMKTPFLVATCGEQKSCKVL